MSVLSAVRACVVSGHRPRVDGDVAHLSPGVSLPRKALSAWRYRKDDYLALDSLLFFLDNERLKLSEYVRACGQAAVQVVPFGERKALLEYLRGEKDTSAYIDQERESEQQQQGQGQQVQGGQRQAAAQPTQAASGTAPSGQAASVLSTAGARSSSVAATLTGRKRAHDDGAAEEAGVVARRAQHSAASAADTTAAGAEADASPSHTSAAAFPSSSTAISHPLSSHSTAGSAGLPASLRPPSTWQLSEAVAEERVYLTRVSSLQSKSDFSAALAAWDEAQSRRAHKDRHAGHEEERRRKEGKTEHRPGRSGGSGTAASVPSALTPSAAGGIPVIVVPSSLSCCLTLYNARDFLESGQLIPTAEKRAAMAGLAKPPYIRLQRPSCLDKQRVVSFDVLDDVSQLRSADDWRRVVAVFVSGSAWQFDGWPAPYTSPAAIAAHMSAFYMNYSDEPVNKNVQQWRVHRLTAHRDKHHHDRSLQLDFWNTLTEQLKCNNKTNRLNI